MTLPKPRIFIGSSSESLDTAYAVQENLEHVAEITVWTQGIFDLSRFTLDSLLDCLDEFDFGVFVFAPDDMIKLRDEKFQVVRDNVIFELGLFIGRLGKERGIIIYPREQEDFHIPTDLLGITPGTYEPNRQDGNIVAALGPACNRIRKTIQTHGVYCLPQTPDPAHDKEEDYNETDILSLVEHWLGKKPVGSEYSEELYKFSDVERELNIPRGSAKKVFAKAAEGFHMKVVRQGIRTIVLENPPDEDKE